MSRETNGWVMMHCKTVTINMLTIVHPFIVETTTSVAKPKASLWASLSVRQIPWTVTSSKPVISSSQLGFLFFGIMWGTALSQVRNSAESSGGRNRSRKLKWTASRNCIFIIDFIKERYVLCRVPTIRLEVIVEAILSKSFREFSDIGWFVVVRSLNPITKYFPTIGNSHSHSNCRTYP